MRFELMGLLIVMAGLATGQVGLATERYPSPAQASLPAPLLWAQASPLTERVDQIDTCRGTTATLTIFRSSALTGAIGTAPANYSVTLTGIFGAGVVQIRTPLLGWVAAATLSTNCSVPPNDSLPADLDTNPRYCRRLRSSDVDGSAYADLDTGLVARNTPGGDFQYVGNSNQTDGPTKAAIVRFPDRVTDLEDTGDRRWLRIKYTSHQGTPRVGWIPNGPAGVNRSLAACAPGQN